MAKKQWMTYLKVLCVSSILSCSLQSTAAPMKPQSSVKNEVKSNPVVVIETNLGNIKVELDAKVTLTTQNFIHYVNEHYYDNTSFYRVISDFMIQGGGYTPDLKEKPTDKPALINEGAKCDKNDRGVISMARTSDPHSATAIFFINVQNNSFLDYKEPTAQGWGYCGFGKVIDGMAVVDKIQEVPTTTRNGLQNVPVKPIVIQNIHLA